MNRELYDLLSAVEAVVMDHAGDKSDPNIADLVVCWNEWVATKS